MPCTTTPATRRRSRLFSSLLITETSFSPLARLQLSAIYADLGRERESREVLTFADNDWLHGEMPLHRDRLYNDLMEQVAAEQAIPVVDPRQLLDRDPGVYIDVAHFDARGHQMVAGSAQGRYLHLASDAMNILGLSAYYHDRAAALVCDGEIVAAAQEERFTRKKHDQEFPAQAIECCLDAAGLTPERLDFVGFYDKPFLKFERLLGDLPGVRSGRLSIVPQGDAPMAAEEAPPAT